MSVRTIIDVKGEVVPIEIQNHEQDMSAPSEINSSAPEPSFGFGVTGQRFAPLDGIGNLLFQMHSSFMTAPFCEKQETTLQFYEYVVVAIVNKKLWCFPSRTETRVIPRFKIVDASFTLGPRKISSIVWALLLLSVVFILIGATNGGCNTYCYGYSSWSTCFNSSGACAWLVIGCIILVIPVPIFLLVPWFFKMHHVYLDTKSARRCCCKCSGTLSYDFCFQKVGFEHATDDKATFDQFYLFDYICKPFSKQGDNMSDYHLLSHFNYVDLANPIYPVHQGGSQVCSSDVIHRHRKGKTGSVSVGQTHRSHLAKKSIEV